MATDKPADHTEMNNATEAPTRLFWVLTVIPLLAFLATMLAYIAAWPYLPESIAIHVGPDGSGFGSLQTTAMFSSGLALTTLAFGTRYTLNRLTIGYCHMAEKTTMAAFISMGYSSMATLLILVLGGWGKPAKPHRSAPSPCRFSFSH